MDVIDHLLPPVEPTAASESAARPDFLWVPREELSVDKLVTGALEGGFQRHGQWLDRGADGGGGGGVGAGGGQYCYWSESDNIIVRLRPDGVWTEIKGGSTEVL